MKKVLFFCVLVGMSCDKKATQATETNTQATINVEIVRMDSLLFGTKTASEISKILSAEPWVNLPYFDANPDQTSELAIKLNGFVQNSALKEFYLLSIDQPNGLIVNQIKEDLSTAFSKIKAYDPNFKIPKVYTYFSGFAGKDLMVTDSTICIGLEYFLGKKAKYLPQVYDYQLYKYQPQLLVPNIINQIAVRYAKLNGQDKSLLADMIFYGKCFAFTKYTLSQPADSLVLGIGGEKLTETEASQKIVWAHFIDQKLLYENSEFKKSKYIDERPNVPEISQDCPGTIGRWLGWKIVNKYLEGNDADLSKLKALMDNPNAQQIFETSGYRGED